MIGFAIIAAELPAALLEPVQKRLHDRCGCLEARFEWWHELAVLPVRWDGSLRLLQWGCKQRRSRLPHGGFLTRQQVEAGIVAGLDEVVIPANYGFHHGTWYLIEEGVRGVVIPEAPLVYVLMDRSTNYYRNMTGQSPLMPMLVNQVI